MRVIGSPMTTRRARLAPRNVPFARLAHREHERTLPGSEVLGTRWCTVFEGCICGMDGRSVPGASVMMKELFRRENTRRAYHPGDRNINVNRPFSWERR